MEYNEDSLDHSLAPIVLFAYNRPWHTKQTLEALSLNRLANKSKLYVFLDGLKKHVLKEDKTNWEEVEKVVLSKKWCGSVDLIKRETNLGLADNIVDGVTTIVNQYGKIIVLEDDIVTSKGFLKYMNDALDIYVGEEQVMHISGYMFPVKKKYKLPETFFYNVNSCWGWATWKRAWKYYEHDIKNVYNSLKHKNVNWKKFNNGQNDEYQHQVLNNLNGIIKTWAVKWHSAIYLNAGFSLHPVKSLTYNIGFDGSGTNCGDSKRVQLFNPAQYIQVKKIQKVESNDAIMAVSEFFEAKKKGRKLSLFERIIIKLKEIFSK